MWSRISTFFCYVIYIVIVFGNGWVCVCLRIACTVIYYISGWLHLEQINKNLLVVENKSILALIFFFISEYSTRYFSKNHIFCIYIHSIYLDIIIIKLSNNKHFQLLDLKWQIVFKSFSKIFVPPVQTENQSFIYPPKSNNNKKKNISYLSNDIHSLYINCLKKEFSKLFVASFK